MQGFLQYGTYNIASNEAKSNYMPILPWVDTYVSHPAPTTQKELFHPIGLLFLVYGCMNYNFSD